MRILLVSSRPASLQAFTVELRKTPGLVLEQVGSGEEALAKCRAEAPDLVLIDDAPAGCTSLGLVQSVLETNAMISTAVVSPLSEAEFHERSEGLGVLTPLPMEPGPEDARMLVSRLRGVLGLS